MSGNDTPSRLLQESKNLERQGEIAVENEKEYKEAINRLFSTPDGEFLAKYLIKYSGIFVAEPSTNPLQMAENNGKKLVYLRLVRGYLDNSLKHKLESL